MASGQDVRIIHVAEVIGSLLGVAVTIARTLRWLGTHGLFERALRTLRTVEMLIDAALRAAALAGIPGRLVEQDLVSRGYDEDGTSTWRENEQDRALNRVPREAAANGVHRRNRRVYDEGGRMPIMVAKPRGAPIGKDALHNAASFDNQPAREELERVSARGLSPRADASVPSLIVQFPPCNSSNGFVASRLTISNCRDLVSCLPASLLAHLNGCRWLGMPVTASITFMAA